MVIKKVRPIERVEEIVEKKLDLSLFRKKGNSKTFKSYMVQKMKEAKKIENHELALLIQHFYKKFCDYETSETLQLESWKGKDNIELIEEPDKIIVVWHKKADKGEKAKEHRNEIGKDEINKVLIAINKLDEGEKIGTPDIAEETYKKSWKDIFSNRKQHITFTHIMNILEMKNLIHYYRSGSIRVLKKVKNIQEVLK